MIQHNVGTIASRCEDTTDGFDAIFYDVFYTYGRRGDVAMVDGKYVMIIPSSSNYSSTHAYTKLRDANPARPIRGREVESIDNRSGGANVLWNR